MKWRLVLLAALSSVAVLVPAAQGTLRTTDPTQEIRVIVKLRDAGISVTPNVAPRGAVALFVVSNVGKKPHAFAVGEGSGGVAAQANITYKKGLATRVVKPGSKPQILLIFLDFRGQLPYHSWVKEDLNNPRMKGVFTIQ